MSFPVEWVALEKLQEILQTITKDNGYYENVRRVYLEERDPEKIEEFGAINIITGNVSYSHEVSEAEKLTKSSDVIILDCYMEGEENRKKRSILLASDIEKALFSTEDTDPPNGVFPWNLHGTCHLIWPVDCRRFNLEADKHLFGIEFNIKMWWRQDIKDPGSLVP